MQKELKKLYYESVKKRQFNRLLSRDEQSTYFEGMMDACFNLGNMLNLDLSSWDANLSYHYFSVVGRSQPKWRFTLTLKNW